MGKGIERQAVVIGEQDGQERREQQIFQPVFQQENSHQKHGHGGIKHIEEGEVAQRVARKGLPVARQLRFIAETYVFIQALAVHQECAGKPVADHHRSRGHGMVVYQHPPGKKPQGVVK